MADNGIDYKKKYEDLKARYIQSLDVAFRTGYEQGFSESQNQAISEQQLETADELDQAISTLEQLVSKSEPSIEDLKKSIEMIKTEHLHKKITKKTKSIDITPKQYSQSYRVNLPENSKAEVAMQQRIVDDILRKWEKEQGQSSRDITQVLGTEALTKKE